MSFVYVMPVKGDKMTAEPTKKEKEEVIKPVTDEDEDDDDDIEFDEEEKDDENIDTEEESE
jgi:hypothetical protein